MTDARSHLASMAALYQSFRRLGLWQNHEWCRYKWMWELKRGLR